MVPAPKTTAPLGAVYTVASEKLVLPSASTTGDRATTAALPGVFSKKVRSYS